MLQRIHQFPFCPMVLIAVLIVCAAVPAYGTPILSLVPNFSGIVEPGQSVSYNIDITGAAGLYSWAFSLLVDPSVLSITGAVEGSFLAGGGETLFLPGIIDNSEGRLFAVGDALVGPVVGVGGSGILATVSFDITGLGTSNIDMFSIKLLDSQGNQIQIGPPGQGSISSVPEPATFALLGLGMTAVALLRRRAKRAG
jgi:hypothetical protein